MVGTKAYYVTRGPVQGRGCLPVRHVAQQFRRLLGAGASTRTAWSRSNTCSRARARTRPVRRGAGSSALDAVELMDVGWNFRREHLRLAQRSHYVITNGGDQPNVVPPTAAVWYYFREADYDHIMDMWHIGDNMAKGATLMTDTDLHRAPAGQRLAGIFQQGRSPRTCTRTSRRSGCRSGRRTIRRWRALADRAEGAGERPAHAGSGDARAAPAGGRCGRWRIRRRSQHAHRRRFGRYRRRLLERAHGDPALSRPIFPADRGTTGRTASPWPRPSRTKA